LRELIVKKSLVDAANLLLYHLDTVVILSRNLDGSPSILEYNNAGRLIGALGFIYED